MKKGLLWLWLLTKRLYKKPTFLALLVLIPLLVAGYTAVAGEDSGMITVALAWEEDSELTESVVESLESQGQLIRYIRCSSPEQAEDLVRGGKADCAWIFPEDMQAAMEAFAAEPEENNAFVTVLEREDNVALRLARERLSGALYVPLAEMFYVNYIRETFPAMADLSDEELLDYYQGTELSDTLFAYDETAPMKTQQVHYLMAPVRGLLAVVMVLCGMAAAMYWVRDMEQGTFAWMPRKKLWQPELCCQCVSLANVGAVVLLTLVISGMASGLGTELVALVMYCLCTAAFCMLLRRICGGNRMLGVVLPLLTVAMLVVCPVFFDLGMMRTVQFFLPPTYYINAVHNPVYMLWMAGYTAIAFGLFWLLGKIPQKA